MVGSGFGARSACADGDFVQDLGIGEFADVEDLQLNALKVTQNRLDLRRRSRSRAGAGRQAGACRSNSRES